MRSIKLTGEAMPARSQSQLFDAYIDRNQKQRPMMSKVMGP